MIKKVKGTLDILPDEMALWHVIENTARDTSEKYGFGEIRFPTFEQSALFKRGVGDSSDIVQKEMFTLSDRDGNELCLRPEGTACIARSVIENGLFNEPMPLKLYYISNFFRYEKPQAGRSREFYQFGVEMFGSSLPSADASVISLADSVIKKTGVRADLFINSIGCKNCRPNYHKILVNYLEENADSLCGTCRERLKLNPLRILDCKNPECQKIALGAPKTIDYLCDDCKNHFSILKETLTNLGISFEINPGLVRGLDYYTKTVFEFISRDIGAQGTICGGGRYDGLIEQLGGPSLCGIGFGMGITRLILAMKKAAELEECPLPKKASPKIYIAPMGESAGFFSSKLAYDLRSRGVSAEFDVMGRSLKSQMKYADKLGAEFVLVLGENELSEKVAELKNLRTGEKYPINLSFASDDIYAVISESKL